VAGAGIVGVLGSSGPVVSGAALGLVAGWAGSAFELRLLRPHLRSDFPRALRIVALGFGVRLLAILLGLVFLDRSGLADGSAFAVGVVGGFVAFFPLLAAVARSLEKNGEARG
jgi:hypothetical protein